MALILNEKYIGINNSFRLFISNRFLRLFPIYWTILILSIAFSIALAIYTHGFSQGNLGIYTEYFNKINFKSFLFLTFVNVFIFLQDSIMFLGLNTSNGNLFFSSNFYETSPMLYQFLIIPQAWTVGVEISFYLIAPFIVRKKIKFIIFLIMVSLLLRSILYIKFGLNHDPWTYRFFPTELVFFLLGVVSYHLYKKIDKIEVKNIFFILIFFSLLGFSLAYNFILIHGKSYFYFTAFFISLPCIFILTKKWKYDAYIGELSYPIYISHMFVLSIINIFKIPLIGGLGLTLTIATTLFAILLNNLIAKKIEKIRQNRIL